MPDPTAREQLLIKYLNEAYGKERQLETALQAQIKIIQKPAINKRLKDHLKETKAQAKGLERRIKQLGGKTSTNDLPGPDVATGAVTSVANKAVAAAKGPVQALRGTGAADNQLRNARDCYWNEAEEIAHYNVIEAAASELGDKETVKLARDYRRQEERVQTFLEKQMPGLVKDVIKEEVPAKERKPAAASSSRSTSRSSSSRSSGSSRTKSSSGSSRTKSSSGSSRTKSASSGSSRTKAASSSSRSKSTSKSAPKTASRAKTSGSSNGRSASSRRSTAKSGNSKS